ncbi:MAG: siphovirus Gp157 family protein [Ignavibacteriales bacterium]|nr:siphovirus Gp157 family protein [Ignavibacteriales bacterium]
MNKNLYGINAQVESLLDNSVDEETGEIQDGVFEQLQELALTKQELIKHTSLKYKDVLGEINKVSTEIERLSAYKKQLSSLNDRIKRHLSANIMEGEKIKELEYEISWRKSETIELDDITFDIDKLERDYPECVRTKKEVDKIALKKMAVLPEGVTKITKQNIQIK